MRNGWFGWISCALLTIMMISIDFGAKTFAAASDFAAVPILPDNQLPEVTGYFDLLVKAGEKQTLAVQVTNQLDKEQTLMVELTNAVTSDVGTIDYTADLERLSSDQSLPLTSLVKGPEKVVLKAKEMQTLEFELSVPKKAFAGMILGGIYLKPASEATAQEDQKGIQVQTTYSRLIAIRLQETQEKVKPELVLTNVQPQVIEDGRVFLATIENTEPVIVEDLAVEATILKKGSEETPIYTEKTEGMRMAPQSAFPYRIFIGEATFDSGSYLLRLRIHSTEKEWELQREFKVSKKEADHLNQLVLMEEVSQKANSSLLGWLVGLVVTLVVIGVVVVLIEHKRKSQRKRPRRFDKKLRNAQPKVVEPRKRRQKLKKISKK